MKLLQNDEILMKLNDIIEQNSHINDNLKCQRNFLTKCQRDLNKMSMKFQ